jgi:hypothetical protein
MHRAPRGTLKKTLSPVNTNKFLRLCIETLTHLDPHLEDGGEKNTMALRFTRINATQRGCWGMGEKKRVAF